MTFTPEQTKALEAKLDEKHVKPPPQGKYGSYIPAWHVINEANRIFGFDGWSYSMIRLDVTNAGWRKVTDRDGREYDRFDCGYMAVVQASVGSVVREDVGHGQGYSKTSEGDAHDSAIKEAVTDSLKRCLRTFGNPFGLALYDKSGENVERSNGSTRPPPKQHEPTVTADDLVERVSMATTFQALKATKGHEGFRHDYLSLDKAGRAKVEAAIAEKEAEFVNPLGGG